MKNTTEKSLKYFTNRSLMELLIKLSHWIIKYRLRHHCTRPRAPWIVISKRRSLFFSSLRMFSLEFSTPSFRPYNNFPSIWYQTKLSSTEQYQLSPCPDKINSHRNSVAPPMQTETRTATPETHSSSVLPTRTEFSPATNPNPNRRFSGTL